ncbi:MAG: hypothetical protein AAF800_01930 [Planctomycetota bacterium]
MAESSAAEQAMQGYFDWQVTTLMLAYDLQDPVDPADEGAGERRRRAVEEEVRAFSLAVVPDVYQNDPSLAWPADVMRDLTRATLGRAAQVAGAG